MVLALVLVPLTLALIWNPAVRCGSGPVPESESARRVIFIVNDPTFTDSLWIDWTKPFYDRLSNSGYIVDLTSHSQISYVNFSSYDAAVVHWDYEYLSVPKNYSNLLSSGIGFVFMSADVEKVGLGSGAGATSYGTAVDIVNVSNYVTQPFSSGSVEVYSTPSYRNYAQRPANGTLLANITDGDVILVTDRGIYFGLPRGSDLTSDGWTLFDRSVELACTKTIPEFPSFLIMPLFTIPALLAVVACRRKRLSTPAQT